MLVGKAAGKIFHDPKIPFDDEAYDKASPLIGDKALIVGSYQFIDWDNLKQDIRYAVLAEDAQDVIIDPVTAFTAGMSASETNEFLNGMAAELSAMAMDLDFTAYIFCHLKAPDNGPPHERGGKVYSTQFAGSRAMMRSCNYMIGMEGNKDPELDVDARNFRQLVLLEDREYGNVGTVNLWWNKATGLFQEVR
jgi:twinkle protein